MKPSLQPLTHPVGHLPITLGQIPALERVPKRAHPTADSRSPVLHIARQRLLERRLRNRRIYLQSQHDRIVVRGEGAAKTTAVPPHISLIKREGNTRLEEETHRQDH